MRQRVQTPTMRHTHHDLLDIERRLQDYLVDQRDQRIQSLQAVPTFSRKSCVEILFESFDFGQQFKLITLLGIGHKLHGRLVFDLVL